MPSKAHSHNPKSRTLGNMRCVGRLAPSPTGAQHIGNARTYLVAWLSARVKGGTVRLRIEDIDSPRIKAGAAEQALRRSPLARARLGWRSRSCRPNGFRITRPHCDELKQQELVYPCTCTRADIAAAASARTPSTRDRAIRAPVSHRRVADADNAQRGRSNVCLAFSRRGEPALHR